METFIFGVLTFVLVLGPLVLLHEFGHFFVAKAFGVKVLEYGFGFPPRAGGFWTGRAVIHLTGETWFAPVKVKDANSPALATGYGDLRSGLSPEQANRPKVGDIVTVRGVEVAPGRIEATVVRHKMALDEDEQTGGLVYVGKVREIQQDQIVLADMLWSFNWLPLGGFVRLLGEEDPSAEGSLASKGRGARIAVMAAGAAVNAIIPFILLPLVLLIPQNVQVGDVTIASVFPGSPAAEAGIRTGDRVVRVDGRKIETLGDLQSAVTLKLGAETHWEIQRGIADPFARAGEPQYQYTGEIEELTVVPRWKPPAREVVISVDDPDTQLRLGEARIYDRYAGISNSLTVVTSVTDTARQISLSDALRFYSQAQVGDVLNVVPDGVDSPDQADIPYTEARQFNADIGLRTRVQEGATGVQIAMVNVQTVRRSVPFFSSWGEGARQAWDSIVLTRNAITGLAMRSQNPQFTETPTFTGPVGIGQLTGEIAVAEASVAAKIATLASLAAVISFSLAVINILPIPALDGGRIFFVLVEILRGGRRISPEREGLVHLAGFIILLAFIAIISVQDIARIFRGESFF